jgi:hypothetical protein
MASFGINTHAHVDAAVFSIVLPLLTYGVKWAFGLRFPDLIFGVPTFIAVFVVFYLILFGVFLIAWSKK